MGIFKSFLFGDMKKSVDAFTMYVRNGQNIVRKKALVIRNPRTPKQQGQRSKMTYVVQAAQLLSPVYAVGFPERRSNQTGYGAFVSANLSAFDKGVVSPTAFPWKKLSCSAGSLAVPDMTVVREGDCFVFELNYDSDVPRAFSDDEVYVVLVAQDRSDADYTVLCERSHLGRVSLPIHLDVREGVSVYAFARSRDGLLASNTVCLACVEEGSLLQVAEQR